MTKVKELIRNSTFIKTKDFDNLKPEVSIFLPTYRRGDNGLFETAVKSLLAQSFTNFELIIIDDASVDSTASIYKKYMEKDARIAVIRHEKNIGLPAVSEYEAYMKSRANKIFFAFDDNEVNPHAIDILFDYLEHRDVPFVYAKTMVEGINYAEGQKFNYDTLFNQNIIPNCPLLIWRETLENTGLYDPHIAMTRICDWDLWLRIAKEKTPAFINKVLSVEKGVTQNDSLGNSYPLDSGLVKEWMCRERNEYLRPNVFHEYEFDEIPHNLSLAAKQSINGLMKQKFSRFFWGKGLSHDKHNEPYIVVLCDVNDACIELAWENLSRKFQERVIVINLRYIRIFDYFQLIMNASGVVFTRMINDYVLNLASILKKCGVPYYYYTDDNFFQLGLMELDDNNRAFLENADACILSSEKLIEFYSKENLNSNLWFVRPCISEKQYENLKPDLKKFENKEINFLYASNHRVEGLLELFPAIEKFSENYKINFYIFKRNEQHKEMAKFLKLLKGIGANIYFEDFECHHNAFIEKLKKLNIHFILHPDGKNHPFYAKNYQNKTLNPLLNSYLTTSVVLLPDMGVYQCLHEFDYLRDILYQAPDDACQIFEKFLKDRDYTKRYFEALSAFCKKEFSFTENEAVIQKMFVRGQERKRLNAKQLSGYIEKMRKLYCPVSSQKIKYKCFGLVWLKVKISEKYKKFYLFGVPFFQIKKGKSKCKYKLFGLPIYSKKELF